MKETSEAEKRIQETADRLSLTMEAEFVPWSKSRNAGEKSPSLNWKVTISKTGRPILTTDYGAGRGHCPAYKASVADLGGHNSLNRSEVIRWECEHGKRARYSVATGTVLGGADPIVPKLADVLSSLCLDASVIDCGTFEEWAGDMGENTDSRKAEAIYRACLETALKLRSGIGEEGLKQLREACQDY